MKIALRARARALSVALVLVALVVAACGDDGAGESGPAAPTTESTTTVPAAGHTHGAGEALEVTWSPVPTVSVEVLEDPMAGWNLHASVTGHRLAPENVSTAPVEGEGHMHLYVDGVKVTRLYGEWFALGELDPGEHEIRVELSANDHSPLAVDGEVIDATVTVTVPGEPSDDEMSDGEMSDDAMSDGEMSDDAMSDGEGHVIALEVVDGSVVGGAQDHEVATGETVTLTVISDTADEVHVHGYDLFVDVGPARAAQLTFEARFEGGYEIELEGAGLLLGQLVVG